MIKTALLSVRTKPACSNSRRLCAHGVKLFSTGGTAKLLADAGLPVEVATHTGFPGDARRSRQNPASENPRRVARAS